MGRQGSGTDRLRECPCPGLGLFWRENGVDIELLEVEAVFFRIEHIGELVNAELLQDPLQLFFQHFTHAQLDGVFQGEVESPHHVGLADAINPTDALLQLHRIPGQVVVDDHVAELQVQALAAGIGGDQDLGLVGERPLCALALLQVHGAIEHHDRITALLQDLLQHLLGGYELGEQQHLEGWVVLVPL